MPIELAYSHKLITPAPKMRNPELLTFLMYTDEKLVSEVSTVLKIASVY